MTNAAVAIARGFSLQGENRGFPEGSCGLRRLSGEVGFAQRLSNVLFGSPNVRAAFGLCVASPSAESSGSGHLPRRCSEPLMAASSRRFGSGGIPVYAVDAPDASRHGSLPRVWLSEPIRDERTGEVVAREFSASYPCGRDEGGERAFRLASSCLGEGLSYFRATDDRVRIQCFKAAELLLLHAARRGNLEAHVALGSLYESDSCEGSYYGVLSGEGEVSSRCLDARALEHFSHAAARGNAEACLKLGEMTAAGRGCDRDERRALDLFVRAFGIADAEGDALVGGGAALSIARAYEEGSGCEQSFKRAYTWYRIAEDELAYVVDEGAWHGKKALLRASVGVKRMRQELLGGY